MKELTKTSRIAGELEKIFRTLNTEIFDDELDMPMITVEHIRTDANVSALPSWNTKRGEKYGLQIAQNVLRRPLDNVIEVLLHQMIHLWCYQNNISDSSRGGHYHNIKFATLATEKGLTVVPHPTQGWTVTGINDDLLEFIATQGWPEHILPPDEPNAEDATPKKKGSTRRLVCPQCGAIVRATRDVNLLCLDCDVPMDKVS